MKLLTSTLTALGLVTTCIAHGRLFVASNSGNITTLDVVHGSHGTSLAVLATHDGCSPTPSWLELDINTSTLYCTNEGINNGAASISSFHVEDDGSLVLNSMLDTAFGGVSSAIFGNGSKLAIAHFNDFITTVSLAQFNKLEIINSMNITTNSSTPAKPHQVLLDPFENYLFVPAFGTDQVHWFAIDPVTNNLTHTDHITLHKDSGPRHGVFYLPTGSDGSIAYYYVVTETSNKIYGFEVRYDTNHKIIGTKQIWEDTTFMDAIWDKTYAAEISLSPDNKFLIVSSRNDTRSLQTHYPDPLTNITLPDTMVDTIISFALSPTNGTLSKPLRTPAGGKWPRDFSLNRVGDLMAVALQKDHKIVLIKRDVETGKLEDKVLSEIVLDGEVYAVIWDEEKDEEVVVGGGPVQNGTWTWGGYEGTSMPATTLMTSTLIASGSGAGVSTAGYTPALSVGATATHATEDETTMATSLPLYFPTPTTAVGVSTAGYTPTLAMGATATGVAPMPATMVMGAQYAAGPNDTEDIVNGVAAGGQKDDY